jgi:hypothetical protein
MKLVLGIFGTALLAVGLGVACGPKVKYCYEEGKSCEEAWKDLVVRCEDEQDAIRDAGGTANRDCINEIPRNPTASSALNAAPGPDAGP